MEIHNLTARYLKYNSLCFIAVQIPCDIDIALTNVAMMINLSDTVALLRMIRIKVLPRLQSFDPVKKLA